jgi:GNAT superfamily N-acetyltransferase
MYEVVPYQPELKPQIARLQRHLWRGGEAANREYLEWKYERNPYLPAPLIRLVVHDGQVVGMRGMFGSCWEAGANAEGAVVPCGDDLVIAPAHRKRGLLGRLLKAAVTDLEDHGHRLTFSLSAGPAALAGSLAHGWQTVASMGEVTRVDRPASWRWRLGTRMRSWRGLWRWADVVSHSWRRQVFRRLDRMAPHAPAGRAVWCTSRPRPEAMAALVRRLGHDGRIRHVRDAAYLAWRFANPRHEYRFLLVGEEGADGYLVLQAYRFVEARRANVVDWEASGPATRRALLDAALEWGRFPELSVWTLGLPEETRGWLRETGFAARARYRLQPQGPSVLLRTAAPSLMQDDGPGLGGRRLLDGANWDMRMVYSMAG